MKDIKQNIKFKAYIKLLLFLIKNIIIQQDLTSIFFFLKKRDAKTTNKRATRKSRKARCLKSGDFHIFL